MISKSLFQLDLAFFGLTSENIPIIRANLFSQIHEIVFHGQGGYDWETVYNMPVWLRNFTFNKIKEGKIDLPSHFKGKLGKTPKY